MRSTAVSPATRANLYAAVVILAGTLSAIISLARWECAHLGRFACLALFAVAASRIKFRIPGVAGTVTASLFILCINVVELSLGETVAIALGAAVTQTFWRARNRPSPLKVAFNLSVLASAIAACYLSYHWLVANRPDWGTPFALLVAAGIYFCLNTAPVAFIIALTERRSFVAIWRGTGFMMFPFYTAAMALAGLLHHLGVLAGWQVTFLVLPVLYLVHHSYEAFIGRMEDAQRHGRDVAALQLRSIQTMALAVEAKDTTTATHLHRVQTYAMALGEDLGLSPDEMQALRAASILHDVGKLAVPEHIISKPGKLTTEEFERMKTHTVVGAEIAESMGFPYPVAPIVRAHHEKWNGKGYPDGLAGEQIPIGARILSAVDCLDALATDRQYRKALPLDQAMDIVRKDSGHAFDPRVVDVLARRYRELERAAVDSLDETRSKGLAIHAVIQRGAAPDAGLEQDGRPPDAPVDRSRELDEMAILLWSVHSLVDDFSSPIALANGLSRLLQSAIPHDAIALFRFEGALASVVAASGIDADLLASVRSPEGKGIAGWVAGHQQAIINGSPGVEHASVAWARATTLKSALAVPVADSTVRGVFALYGCAEGHFSRRHLRILSLIAPRLVPCLTPVAGASGGPRPESEAREFLRLLDVVLQQPPGPAPAYLVRLDLNQGHELLRASTAILRDALGGAPVARLGPAHLGALARGLDLAALDRCLSEAILRLPAADGDAPVARAIVPLPQAGASLEELLALAERAVAEDRHRLHSGSIGRLAQALQPTAAPICGITKEAQACNPPSSSPAKNTPSAN